MIKSPVMLGAGRGSAPAAGVLIAWYEESGWPHGEGVTGRGWIAGAGHMFAAVCTAGAFAAGCEAGMPAPGCGAGVFAAGCGAGVLAAGCGTGGGVGVGGGGGNASSFTTGAASAVGVSEVVGCAGSTPVVIWYGPTGWAGAGASVGFAAAARLGSWL
jgi:hypothetical protein